MLFNLLGTGIVSIGLACISEASVPRAFVSINGIDTNPCSATQPCRSFNQALTVVEPGGEIVVQNSGGYSTGFTITQSVTIDAAGCNASVISTSNTDLCTVSAGPTDRVVLRGISFHGANIGNNGINVTQVGSLYVEHCSIAEFNGIGVFMLSSGFLSVTNADVRKCLIAVDVQNFGLSPAILAGQDSRFSECVEGASLATAGTGGASGRLSNCTASLCRIGFSVATGNSDANLTLANCRAFGNNTGLQAQTSTLQPGNATMRIVNCVVTGNTVGVSASSGPSGGIAAVLGTNLAPGGPQGPRGGSNLISGNGSNNFATGTSITLQ
jgi:hypothetical protein